MSEPLNNLATIRQYLLGKISDETMLEGIEELLFLDDEFCTKVEIIEDELINDYVFGKLNAEDNLSFEKTLENNPDRRAKVKVTKLLKEKTATYPIEEKISIFDSIKSFFRQPIYAGGFALLLIAILIGAILLSRSTNNSELAELKNIYKDNRPIESRISEFDYAPYEVTRGEDKLTDAEKRKLKIIENDLLKRVDGNPNASNHNSLGVFYLSQRKYLESTKELEESIKLEPTNPNFRNDLGSAYFELGKFSKEKQFENFSKSNEEFAKAIELNPNFLEALFNRALALRELNAWNQAKEVWNLYLQKDSTSKWADEARKNLEKIEQTQKNLGKKKDEVLNDFLMAYRDKDEKNVWKIHNSTKGVFNGISLAEQLSQRFLEARQNKEDPAAKESIEALTYIGKLEKEKHADFFFTDLADYYAEIDEAKIDKILRAKELINEGRKLLYATKYSESIVSFEESKKIFEQNGNYTEANISEIWVTQMLQDANKVDESAQRLNILTKKAEQKNYKTILASGLNWLANCEFKKNNSFKSIEFTKKSLKVAEASENIYEILQNSQSLTSYYLDLKAIDQALTFFNEANNNSEFYYQNSSQVWRNALYGTEITRNIGNLKTSVDFGKESLAIVLEKMPNQTQAGNNSIRELTKSLIENKEFNEAARIADEAVERAKNLKDSDEKTLILADAFLQRANLQSNLKNCKNALSDYDNSLELYAQKDEVLYNLYQIHQGKLTCFQSLQQTDEFEKELEIVLNLSEENRQNIKKDTLRQSFFESQQFVFDTAIANSLRQSDKEKAFEYAETSKARSLLEFVKSKKSIAEVEQDYGNVAKPLTRTEIQKQIPENVQLVEYALLNDKLAVWVITKSRFDLIEKPLEAAAFEQKINDYRKLIIENKDVDAIKKSGMELYEILVPKDLENGKILCLILDKSLHQIPFASLISTDGKYLIEDFALLYSPSSSVFVAASENAKGKQNAHESLLAIGNPNFDKAENPNLKDLPEAEIEAKEIAKLYEKSNKFIGTEATKNNFLNGLDSAQVIHFAGHFVANNTSPTNSKFVFSDEYLLAFELSDKKLPNSKLAVLSACDTGFEQFNKSEGSIGIARTFLAMGTPLVLASSWQAQSEATKDLMISFHKKRRLEKLSSVEALRQSQLEMLNQKEFSSPFYWAAFSLTGGLTNY